MLTMVLSAKRPAKPLPDAEIRALCRRWRATGDIPALQRVITSNLGMAHRIACHYRNTAIDQEDLFQEAVLGLIRGCERYDPERPERITTYAHWWCMAFVRKYVIANNGAVRFGSYALDRRIIIMLKAASRASAGNINAEDVANALDTTVDRVRMVEQRTGHRDVSLSKPAYAGRDGSASEETLQDLLPDLSDPGPERRAMSSEFRAQVDAVLAKMRPREALIVRRRLMTDETVTLEALGDELGITRERVRQLEQRALEQLRRELVGGRRRRAA
jgi:RNA polymerase sigma-32 factor